MSLSFEPLQELFNQDSAVPAKLMQDTVIEDFKAQELTGVPDLQLQITLSDDGSGDILVRKVDPEKALGYKVYDNETDYFDQLKLDMFVPTEADFAAGGADV